MTDTDSILERIRAGLAKRGHKTKVSEATGIPAPLLTRVANSDWNPTANTMRVLDAAVIKLFPGDLPAPPHQPD